MGERVTAPMVTMIKIRYNKVVLVATQKARGWDSLLAASLCSGCPKPKRYVVGPVEKNEI